jgi:hypothetical protein
MLLRLSLAKWRKGRASLETEEVGSGFSISGMVGRLMCSSTRQEEIGEEIASLRPKTQVAAAIESAGEMKLEQQNSNSALFDDTCDNRGRRLPVPRGKPTRHMSGVHGSSSGHPAGFGYD